jgi:hypothetical protein
MRTRLLSLCIGLWRARSALAPAAGALGLLGCGGGGPMTPTVAQAPAPAPTPLSAPEFFDGWTGQPAAAAIQPASPTMGTRTAVTASGYLTREALFDGKPYYLWPADDEAYVRALVYNEFVPGRRLSRWEQGFDITAAPELLGDARTRSIIEDAAAEASRASGLPISVRSSGVVTVSVDAADPFFDGTSVAYSRRTFRGNVMVGAQVVFLDLKYLVATGNRVRTNTMLHELGHVLGFGHSIDPDDVMYVDGKRTDLREFSPRELVTLRMMYLRRRPGNFAPDKDQAVGAAAATAPATITIACPQP